MVYCMTFFFFQNEFTFRIDPTVAYSVYRFAYT